MKKIILIFVLTLVFKISFSEDIIINFTGYFSSNQVNLNSVLVENSTQGTSILLTENFELNLTTTSVEIENVNGSFENINIFPNPFFSNTNIALNSVKSEKIEILICDYAGKVVYNNYLNINAGTNLFKFTPNNSGFYIVNFRGSYLNFSKSLICLNSTKNALSFELISFAENIKKATLLFYNIGDKLKYTGTYNNMQTVITDSPEIAKSYSFDFYDCTDYDGNNYKIVKIGEQWWMAENLKSTHYSNGTALLDGTSAGDISSNFTGKYYFIYGNNSANLNNYGRLYTWAAVMNGSASTNNVPSGVQGICPSGWHVPSEMEWDNMRDYLGGWQLMHGKVKSIGTEFWNLPNSDATNESGLSVLPGGLRFEDGTFEYIGEQGFFWNTYGFTDTHDASGYTFWSELPDESSYMYTFNQMPCGQSVRCVKN